MDQGDAPTIVESDERAKDRRASPALYMIWDPGANPAQVTLTPTYQIAAVGSDEVPTMRPVVEIDGALTDSQWNAFVERILPDGMFVARRAASQDVIGTVSAVHNPRGARYYFPAGGQIGYLVVAADHRGQRLGHGLR
jgi:hypothetical protein